MNRAILSRSHNQGSSDLRGEVQRGQRAGIPSERATFFSPLITGRGDSWTKLDRQVLGFGLYQFPPRPSVSSRAPHSVFISRTFIHLRRCPSTFQLTPTFSSPVPCNAFRLGEEEQWAPRHSLENLLLRLESRKAVTLELGAMMVQWQSAAAVEECWPSGQDCRNWIFTIARPRTNQLVCVKQVMLS